MVTIAVTSESADEPRVAVSPDTVKKFTGLGAKVRVESGAGLRSRFSDEAYRAAGAETVARMIDPFGDREALDALAATGTTVFSMEFMPRISRAQSMDVLSSQANLA